MTNAEKIEEIANANASDAWDQREAYENKGRAFGAYWTNVLDTMNEEHLSHVDGAEEIAFNAFLARYVAEVSRG